MVSIILCTYNGEKKLPRTLNAIINQKTRYPWELIVIDNNSNDNSFSFSNSQLRKSNIDYRIEQFPKPGKMFAFWYGISLAKYDFILDCDDDNEFFQDYLELGISILLSNEKIGALGGQGILPKQEVPQWFKIYSKSFALGPQGRNLEPLPRFAHLYGAGCFYRKSIFLELEKKGFESLLSCRKGEELSSGGDVEFCHAIQLEGYDLIYSESLKFYHYIDKGRIDFDYYLRLKAGISSSFPILNSYRIDNFKTQKEFKKDLWLIFFILIKGLVKTALLPRNTYQRKVDYIVVRAKFWSFLKNYQFALDGYTRNKKIFES
ncbi:glycosyltransferase family 2 protein [Algoriphagus taiwanensis]|uniref:Glycosyltransferase 2-like domain-containing protein n=1 Tax=Algoriphagus taiwanensis TaxID=1445656 RepID=A0ABQ6Q6C9_9BACT|nr:hypothetical protein Ataiwa_39920 [Algoriphagus taiwanensis]